MDLNTTNATLPPGFAKEIRDRIARVIETYSANDVPAVCRRFGLSTGDVSEAFSSKFGYAHKRLAELSTDSVVQIARSVAQEEGDAELLRLLATVDKISETPRSRLKPPRRTYYSERNGKGQSGGRLDLAATKILFNSEYDKLQEEGYFQEHFGLWCIDEYLIHGKLGGDIEAQLLFSLGKSGLWPISYSIASYSEDDLFSVIEFMFDHISKPIAGRNHQHANCGMHWEKFDSAAGKTEFRATMNVLLARYGEGYELSEAGEVMERAPDGVSNLLSTSLPLIDSNINDRVQSAITKFRQRQSTTDDRRDAVRDLADVLEYLRPQAKTVLAKKDDGALFQIANDFGIRHHNAGQKTDYDPAIWLSWMFYFYLSTIHAVVRFIEKANGKVA